MRRFLSLTLGTAFFCVATLPAQNPTVRWNTIVDSLGIGESPAPAVRIFLDQRFLRYGEPVRVGFRVEEEAFVVIARVDGAGNLTVMHPSGRRGVASVSAGEDHFIRSARFGTRASFVARERPGSSGYVFALASHEPLDLSRLTQRDFSALGPLTVHMDCDGMGVAEASYA